MKLRILILSQWYQPEPEPKIHLLARDLAGRGHRVTTITGIPNYPGGRVYDGYRVRPWPQIEMKDGVRVIRVPLYPDHSRSKLKRVANYSSFALSAAFWGALLASKSDAMWVYHPPLTIGIPAWFISAVRGVPFIYEVQDLWPETVAASGMLDSSTAAGLMGAFAKLLYRRARYITVISPGFKRNIAQKGVAGEKIHVIPNWADEDVYRPVPRNEALATELGLNGKFNVLYAGNMGPAQGLSNVLDAAHMLAADSDVQFVLVGDGVEAGNLQRECRQRKLTNVRFLGRMSVERVVELAALSDVLLVHLKRDPLFEITIPSKTISSLACGRPILTVSEGDPAYVVTSAGAGLACPPEKPAELARCVRALHGMGAEALARLGEAARRAYLENYTRERLVPRYEQLLLRVARPVAQ